jgi:hypothetical protein
MAETMGERLFGDRQAMNPVIVNITHSYTAERIRSNQWQPEPGDAFRLITQIQKFKRRLNERPESRLLLVGHSGWSRFAFSAFFPSHDDSLWMEASDLHLSARRTYALGNCEMVYATFRQCMFETVQVPGFQDDSPTFPMSGESKLSPIVSLEEAKRTHVVPEDATMARITLGKRNKLGGWKDRLFTLSASGGTAHLSWTSKWCKPKGSIPINDGKMSFKANRRSCSFSVTHISWDPEKAMELKASSMEDFDRFYCLLQDFQNYRSPIERTSVQRFSIGLPTPCEELVN